MIEIRVRHVEVEGVGCFDVPTNVSRVDHKTTHGWFVRFWTKRLSVTKLFSDNPFGGPHESFKAACAYADIYRPMPKTQAIEDEGGGMRFIEAYKGGRKTRLSTSSYPESSMPWHPSGYMSGRGTRTLQSVAKWRGRRAC